MDVRYGASCALVALAAIALVIVGKGGARAETFAECGGNGSAFVDARIERRASGEEIGYDVVVAAPSACFHASPDRRVVLDPPEATVTHRIALSDGMCAQAITNIPFSGRVGGEGVSRLVMSIVGPRGVMASGVFAEECPGR